MRSLVRCITCSAVLFIVAACAGPSENDELASSPAELDFNAGDIQGTLSWNGAPLSAQDSVSLYAFESDALSFWINENGYTAKDAATGAHTLGLYANSCIDPVNKLGETSFTIAAASTATANFDLTATAGRVTGSISVNGAPLPNAWVALDTPCGGFTADQNGVFSRLLAPGTYAASVYGSSGKIATIPFTILAGQTADLGVIGIQVGDIQGTLSWNGTPLSTQEALSLYAFESDALSFWINESSYVAQSATAGDHTLGLYANSCVEPANKLGETSFTISAAATASANFDLTATAGRVTGSFSVNGAPLPNAWVALDTACGGFTADQDGVFSRLLTPRTYAAGVYGSSGKIASISFAVLAGQTTDLGAIDFQVGTIQGTVSWNGKLVSAQDALSLYAFESDALSFWINESNYTAPNAAAGAHTLALYTNSCVEPANKLGETSFTVSAASTATANFDLTATAGQVTGSITVNSAPLPNPWIGLDTACGGFTADQDGAFSRLLAPRTYAASVYSTSGKLGSFSFTILVRQTTDVDVGTTLACNTDISNDPCESVDLSGGIGEVGGISLEFTTVTMSGVTTVVESGAGPPPPTGFKIVGFSSQDPRYWDINTTAAYSGPITVCIHYDEKQLRGNNESSLQIDHDDGTGFRHVTTSLDTTADIICGTVNSLSPFIVVEPVMVDGDSDGVSDATDQCPATQSSAVVNTNGCSIDDLVPCSGTSGKTWKNHGAYVKAFTAMARTFRGQGLINAATLDLLVSRASNSNCGG